MAVDPIASDTSAQAHPLRPDLDALAAALAAPLDLHVRGAAATNYVLLAMRQADRHEFEPSDFAALLKLMNIGDAVRHGEPPERAALPRASQP